MGSYMYFIRHGITEGNQKNWYYGQMDIPLAPEGFALIKKLAGDGIYPSAEGADCYTSGLLRTEQTFATIYGDTPHEALPKLQEMNFGAWEGMSFAEIEAADTYRDEFNQWMSMGGDEILFNFPEGESVKDFHARIREGADELIGRHRLKELSCRHNGKDAVSILVCHGGVIAAIMETFFPGERESFWAWIPEPGHGYEVKLENGKASARREF